LLIRLQHFRVRYYRVQHQFQGGGNFLGWQDAHMVTPKILDKQGDSAEVI